MSTELQVDSIEALRGLLRESGNKLQQAADMLARLHKQDPGIIEKLTSGPEALPEGFINGLMRVAERSLHPTLLFNRCPAYRRLSVMAYASQSEIIEKGSVELVVDAESGDVIKIPLVKLEGAQLEQAISHAGLRSRDEQRAYMKRRQVSAPVEKIVGPAYVIRRDKLTILRPCEISRLDVLRLLEQMVAA
jgi:hypothetical protein